MQNESACLLLWRRQLRNKIFLLTTAIFFKLQKLKTRYFFGYLLFKIVVVWAVWLTHQPFSVGTEQYLGEQFSLFQNFCIVHDAE